MAYKATNKFDCSFSVLLHQCSMSDSWLVKTVSNACVPVDFINVSPRSDSLFGTLVIALRRSAADKVESLSRALVSSKSGTSCVVGQNAVRFCSDHEALTYSLELSYHPNTRRGDEFQVTYHMKPRQGLEHVTNASYLVSKLVYDVGLTATLFRFGDRNELDEEEFLLCYGADAAVYCAMTCRSFFTSHANVDYDFVCSSTHMEFAIKRMGLIAPGQLNLM